MSATNKKPTTAPKRTARKVPRKDPFAIEEDTNDTTTASTSVPQPPPVEVIEIDMDVDEPEPPVVAVSPNTPSSPLVASSEPPSPQQEVPTSFNCTLEELTTYLDTLELTSKPKRHLIKLMKDLNKSHMKDMREQKRLEKANKPKRESTFKPIKVTGKLATLLSIERDALVSRQSVTSLFYEMLKAKEIKPVNHVYDLSAHPDITDVLGPARFPSKKADTEGPHVYSFYNMTKYFAPYLENQ